MESLSVFMVMSGVMLRFRAADITQFSCSYVSHVSLKTKGCSVPSGH